MRASSQEKNIQEECQPNQRALLWPVKDNKYYNLESFSARIRCESYYYKRGTKKSAILGCFLALLLKDQRGSVYLYKLRTKKDTRRYAWFGKERGT